jgi:regulator of cell morphogenesis and NO signaling
MSEITKDETVNDIIKKHPNTIGVFTDFKIDTCCGGAVSIEAAALRDGADLNSMMKALNEVIS